MLSELATREHHCRPLPHHLEFALWGERRRYRCDRGAACRVLAGAGMVNGATPAAERTAARQLAAGLEAAEAGWRRLTPPAKERQLQSWSKARQQAYPVITWPDGEATARLRDSVTADLGQLAAERTADKRGKAKAEAAGEVERLVRSLQPTGHQMGGGALLYLRRELDRLAATRSAAGQPIARCGACGQFISKTQAHQCPVSSGTPAVAATGAGDYQPPAELAGYYATLDEYGKAKLAERREYAGLGTMTRGEFAALAAADPEAAARYFSRDDVWVVQVGDTAYPVGRTELAAFAQLAAKRVATAVNSNDPPDRVAKLAANPATPQQVCQQMLEHPHPLVRAALASRRDVDEATIMALYLSSAQRNYRYSGADDELMVSRLQETTVRLQLIRNQNAPTAIMRHALQDNDVLVQTTAAARLRQILSIPRPPNISSGQYLERLACEAQLLYYDLDQEARARVDEYHKKCAVALNPQVLFIGERNALQEEAWADEMNSRPIIDMPTVDARTRAVTATLTPPLSPAEDKALACKNIIYYIDSYFQHYKWATRFWQERLPDEAVRTAKPCAEADARAGVYWSAKTEKAAVDFSRHGEAMVHEVEAQARARNIFTQSYDRFHRSRRPALWEQRERLAPELFQQARAKAESDAQSEAWSGISYDADLPDIAAKQWELEGRNRVAQLPKLWQEEIKREFIQQYCTRYQDAWPRHWQQFLSDFIASARAEADHTVRTSRFGDPSTLAEISFRNNWSGPPNKDSEYYQQAKEIFGSVFVATYDERLSAMGRLDE